MDWCMTGGTEMKNVAVFHWMGPFWEKGFGKDAGDRVSYRIDIPSGMEDGAIGFRYKVEKRENCNFTLERTD